MILWDAASQTSQSASWAITGSEGEATIADKLHDERHIKSYCIKQGTSHVKIIYKIWNLTSRRRITHLLLNTPSK